MPTRGLDGGSQGSARERRIKSLELKAKRLSQKRLLGRYRSRFKGRGIEFRDFREYLAGDDPRTIDWNVTARFGRPFVKNSEEERELSVVLLLDMSASQRFGSGKESKLELAQELTSLLALTALASGDKVGLLTFDDHHHCYLHPSKGRQQKQRLLQSIWQDSPAGADADRREPKSGAATTDHRHRLAQCLEDLDRWLVGRGFLCLVSDFLKPPLLQQDQDSERDRLLRAMRKLSYRHEVLALRTYDRRERSIPAVGELVLRDLGDGRAVRVDTDHSHWKQEFAQRLAAWQQALEQLMRRAQWDWQEFATDVDPLPELLSFLDARVRRR